MPYVVIHIPAAVDPIERGERFEEPLLDAFEEEGIVGEVLGGGSALGTVHGELVITGCDIEMEVDDLARALPVIRWILQKAGAPPETLIRQLEPEDITYRLCEDS